MTAVVVTPRLIPTAPGFPLTDNKSRLIRRLLNKKDAGVTHRFSAHAEFPETNRGHQIEPDRSAHESPLRFLFAVAAGNTGDFLLKNGILLQSPRRLLAGEPYEPRWMFYSASAHPDRCLDSDRPGIAPAVAHLIRTEMIALL